MLKPDVVQIKTEDGLTLPGLLYEARDSKTAAIYLHGNGSSSVFYSRDLKAEQAKALNDRGFSYLFFNNRGAHYIKSFMIRNKVGREQHKNFGMSYEKIKDCIKDIDAAVAFLKRRGYSDFFLVGLSTGANKICVYHYYKPKNVFSKYILLGGGDDTGIYYSQFGEKRFFKLLKEAKEKIRQKKGEEIICELLPDEILSYQSFYDTANPDGDYNVFPFLEVLQDVKLSTKKLFRHFKSITKQTLVVYGENDEYAWGDIKKVVEILKEQKPEFTYKIIKAAGHSFSDHQKELGELIAGWI